MRRQYNQAKANGLIRLLYAGALKSGLPAEFVIAISSRETNIRNILGDVGHGHGLMQIDDRSHEHFLDTVPGGWTRNPGACIDYACQNILKPDYTWISTDYAHFTDRQWLKVTASCYNAGRGNAKAGMLAGDSDLHTTGKNYGADVLKRMDVFKSIIDAESEKHV